MWKMMHVIVGAAVLLLAIGCGSGSTAERSYLKERREKKSEKSTPIRASDVGEETQNATRLAQTSPAEDGKGTTEEWINRQLSLCRGSVLFPQWRARRSGLTKYQVTFEYTLVDGSTQIQRKGYAWEVDLSLKTVSPSRELRADELDNRPSGRRRSLVKTSE
jgi:hypothetical protein